MEGRGASGSIDYEELFDGRRGVEGESSFGIVDASLDSCACVMCWRWFRGWDCQVSVHCGRTLAWRWEIHVECLARGGGW